MLNDFTSITTVYNYIHSNILSKSLIGIATLIAVIIIIRKFIDAFKEATSDEKPANIRHFFSLFHIYIYSLAIVVTAPVMFSIVERGLGAMQDEYISKFSGDVDLSVDKAIREYELNYMNEELQGEDKNFVQVAIAKQWAGLQEWFYTLTLVATKYTFFFFAAGRYLYLILLEIVAPIAIVCFLDESLKQHSITYLKHLLICYLLIPAFLIANTMGVELGKVFIELFNSYSIMAVLCGFVFKLGLLKKAQNYVEKLL